MPFVMMCGLPSSGKTYYTSILSDYFKNKLNKNVLVINESSFISDKNSVYLGKTSLDCLQGSIFHFKKFKFNTFLRLFARERIKR